jgi:hypothetical protein
MKRLSWIVIILASTADAAERPHKWLRRISAAAVCLVNSADLTTTAIGTSHGGIEQNGLLARNGKPAWGRMLAVNIGACAGAVISSRTKQLPAWAVVAGNAAFTVPKAAAVIHNLRQ